MDRAIQRIIDAIRAEHHSVGVLSQPPSPAPPQAPPEAVIAFTDALRQARMGLDCAIFAADTVIAGTDGSPAGDRLATEWGLGVSQLEDARRTVIAVLDSFATAEQAARVATPR